VFHVNPIGAVTKVHLEAAETGASVHVELNPTRSAELDLKAGELVYLAPRHVRVFVPVYSI
jgi:sulfate transport system ATP-binding protein